MVQVVNEGIQSIMNPLHSMYIAICVEFDSIKVA